MKPVSTPEPDCGFAERLDWLLAMVPAVPGGTARFSEGDLVLGLAQLGHAGRREAHAWLAAARGGSVDHSRLSSRLTAALEELFRLPLGYFRDAEVAARADARIQFVAAAAASGVRVLGPCRVLASEMADDELLALHREVAAVLDRHRAEA